MVETAGVLLLSFFPTRGLAAKVIPLDIEMFQLGECGDTGIMLPTPFLCDYPPFFCFAGLLQLINCSPYLSQSCVHAWVIVKSLFLWGTRVGIS